MSKDKHAKEILLRSKRFEPYCDLLTAILEDGKKYTIKEVEKKIESFMKGKVKK